MSFSWEIIGRTFVVLYQKYPLRYDCINSLEDILCLAQISTYPPDNNVNFVENRLTILLPPQPPQQPLLLLPRQSPQMLIILFPAPAVMNHLIDSPPVGEAAEGAVVDEEVGVELAGADAVLVDFFAGVVAVDGDLIFRCIYITQYRLLHSRLRRPSRYRIHYR